MGDKVVELDAYRPRQPHLSGMARCMACKHEWAAVAPVGTGELECPQCQCMRGVWQYNCTGRIGDQKFVCLCGCDVFRLTTIELMCTACGQLMTGWWLGQDPNAGPHRPGAA